MLQNLCHDCPPLTVMICALSSGERVEGFGFPLNSLWNPCMALAVTSYGGGGGETKLK